MSCKVGVLWWVWFWVCIIKWCVVCGFSLLIMKCIMLVWLRFLSFFSIFFCWLKLRFLLLIVIYKCWVWIWSVGLGVEIWFYNFCLLLCYWYLLSLSRIIYKVFKNLLIEWINLFGGVDGDWMYKIKFGWWFNGILFVLII